MRLWLLLLACYTPNYDAGRYRCSAQGECPPEHHCAADNHCWLDGTDPPSLDLSPAPDLAVPLDLSAVDAAPDLLQPASQVFFSSGGGSVSAGGNQLNVSIGGTSFTGSASATSGATVIFGNLCGDSFE